MHGLMQGDWQASTAAGLCADSQRSVYHVITQEQQVPGCCRRARSCIGRLCTPLGSWRALWPQALLVLWAICEASLLLSMLLLVFTKVVDKNWSPELILLTVLLKRLCGVEETTGRQHW